jgi:putative transposase
LACIIQHAIWLYLRFTLTSRDVEELLVERGLDLSYETIRRWVRFRDRAGLASAAASAGRWHLDEMVLRIAGRRLYLWRAVDHEDEILELLIQHRRDKLAAVRLMRKLLMKQGFVPKLAVTDKLRSYATAFQAFPPWPLSRGRNAPQRARRMVSFVWPVIA